MDGLFEILILAKDRGWIPGHLRGLFHIAIGRKIADKEGKAVSAGVTWRELSVLLKSAKYEKEWVRELGLDPATFAPRDREKFWYLAIMSAHVQSDEAKAEAEWLSKRLLTQGFVVSE